MRNPPRFAVPLAVLVSIVPLTIASFVGPAGADTAADCDVAFTTAPDTHLAYTTDPPERLAHVGQTIRLSAGWDPSAWDSLTSAVACVQLNDAHNDALGTSLANPADSGAFDHTFVVPADVPQGSVLCTRMRLAGDPAGPATEAVWVSKTHCFEVDHEVGEASPPADSSSPPVQPATSPGGPAPDAPVAAPAAGTGSPDSGTPGLFSPEGGNSAPGTPVDEAGAPPVTGTATTPSAATASAPGTPEYIALLPQTGFAANGLLHAGERSLAAGLALLVLCGLPRRRRQISRVTSGLS
jgi:hypothetical protein